MRLTILTAAITACTLSATPVLPEELVGAALLSAISDQHFDCKMGDVTLEWIVPEVGPEATTVPYSAVVHGKAVEAEYSLTDAGRLTSDGYGEERQVETLDDGSLQVTRSDGRAMTCKAR